MISIDGAINASHIHGLCFPQTPSNLPCSRSFTGTHSSLVITAFFYLFSNLDLRYWQI